MPLPSVSPPAAVLNVPLTPVLLPTDPVRQHFHVLLWLADARPDQVEAWLADPKMRESWFAFLDSIKSNDLPDAMRGTSRDAVGGAADDVGVGQMKLLKAATNGKDYWSCSKCNKSFSAWAEDMPDYSAEKPPVCPCVNKPVGCTCESRQARYKYSMRGKEKEREAHQITCTYCRSPESRMDKKEALKNQRDIKRHQQHERIRTVDGKQYRSTKNGNRLPLTLEVPVALPKGEQVEMTDAPSVPASQDCVADVPGEGAKATETAAQKLERWFGVELEVGRTISRKTERYVPHHFPIVKAVRPDSWASRAKVQVGSCLVGFEASLDLESGAGAGEEVAAAELAFGDGEGVSESVVELGAALDRILRGRGVGEAERRRRAEQSEPRLYTSGYDSGAGFSGRRVRPSAISFTTNDLQEVVEALPYLEQGGVTLHLLFASPARRVQSYSLPPEARWDDDLEARYALAVEEAAMHEHSETCYKGRSKCDGCRFRYEASIT